MQGLRFLDLELFDPFGSIHSQDLNTSLAAINVEEAFRKYASYSADPVVDIVLGEKKALVLTFLEKFHSRKASL
jgi:hypothetical protein